MLFPRVLPCHQQIQLIQQLVQLQMLQQEQQQHQQMEQEVCGDGVGGSDGDVECVGDDHSSHCNFLFFFLFCFLFSPR